MGLGVALALAAAASWGVSDFLGGLASRTVAVPRVLLLVEGAGLLVVLAVAAASGEPVPGGSFPWLAMATGASGVIGLAFFYRGLAVGSMSVVAPLAATGVTLPVVVGLASGDDLSAVTATGLAATFCGVLLAAREESADGAGRATAAGAGLALLAALGFGGFFALNDVVADDSVLWTLVIARATACVLVALPLVRPAARTPAPPSRRIALGIAAIGLIDLFATWMLAEAVTRGELSVVAVLGNLYPVVTVVLATVTLGERLRPLQAAGVAAALAGVALVVAG